MKKHITEWTDKEWTAYGPSGNRVILDGRQFIDVHTAMTPDLDRIWKDGKGSYFGNPHEGFEIGFSGKGFTATDTEWIVTEYREDHGHVYRAHDFLRFTSEGEAVEWILDRCHPNL